MANSGLQLLGFVLALLGLIANLTATILPQWRVSSFADGSIITAQSYYLGLWMECVWQSTGQLQCKVYDSILALGAAMQATRALMVLSIVMGVIAIGIATMGMKCTHCGDDNKVTKARIAMTGGIIFLVAGLCSLVACSWSANQIVQDFYNPLSPMNKSMEASEAPIPSEMYENYQPANVEKEYEMHFEKDFPLLKPFPQRFCPTSRLLLVLMVFSCVLILSVSILGIQGVQFSKSIQGTQTGMQNITQTIKQKLTSLKAQRNSTEGRLEELKKTLEKEINKLLNVLKLTQSQLDILEQNSRALNCEIVELKSNGSMTGCCPRGWLSFHTSCYWTTQSRDTWQEARKDCEEKKAHLVILNSADEKAFVKTHRLGSNTWIGLTDTSGDWKWVDGSSYTVDPKDWGPGQPDHWYGHGLGGGEDCAHMREDALWNDNICSRTFTWVCEMELGI